MITRNFNLYLNAGHSVPLVINVNQYDSGEQWVFTLYNADGTKYTPSTGAIVGIKSDGLGIINSGSVVDGKVVINETEQMTAAVGKAVFELLIDSQTHGTANFVVLVEEKPGNNADLSESDLSLLQEAIDATSPLPTGGSVGQVLTKTANGSAWSDAGTPTQEQVADAVSDWADEHITVSTGVVIDTSLAVAGAAADSKKVGDEITDLKSALKTVTDNEALTPTKGGYIPLNGSTANVDNPTSSATYSYTVASAKEGEQFTINGTGGIDARLWGFLSANGTVLSKSNQRVKAENLVITAPANAARIVINDNTGSVSYRGVYIDRRVSSLEKDCDELNTAFNKADVYTNVALTFESSAGYYSRDNVFDTGANISAASVSVQGGDEFKLSSSNFYLTAPVVFLNADNAVVDSKWLANNMAAFTDLDILVPMNAVTMLIQKFSGTTVLTKKTSVTFTAVNSILKGKKIAAIGDSITEKNFRAETNWIMWMREWCGVTIQNLGIGGTGFRAGYSTSTNYKPRIDSVDSDADIIGVALSFNDIGSASTVIGTASDTIADNTVAGYANDFFDALITRFPTKPIICYCQSPWINMHYGESRSDELVNVISEICALKGIPYYGDMYKGSVLRPWLLANRQMYFTSDDPENPGIVDDVHPNSEGHKAIARYLYTKYSDNLVTTGLNYK